MGLTEDAWIEISGPPEELERLLGRVEALQKGSIKDPDCYLMQLWYAEARDGLLRLSGMGWSEEPAAQKFWDDYRGDGMMTFYPYVQEVLGDVMAVLNGMVRSTGLEMSGSAGLYDTRNEKEGGFTLVKKKSGGYWFKPGGKHDWPNGID